MIRKHVLWTFPDLLKDDGHSRVSQWHRYRLARLCLIRVYPCRAPFGIDLRPLHHCDVAPTQSGLQGEKHHRLHELVGSQLKY